MFCKIKVKRENNVARVILKERETNKYIIKELFDSSQVKCCHRPSLDLQSNNFCFWNLSSCDIFLCCLNYIWEWKRKKKKMWERIKGFKVDHSPFHVFLLLLFFLCLTRFFCVLTPVALIELLRCSGNSKVSLFWHIN